MAIDVKNYRSPRGAVVNVVSREELVMVLEFFEEEGYRWCEGELPTEAETTIRFSYSEYGERLCICFYEEDDEEPLLLSYCDIEYFEQRGYDIFSAEELLGSEAPEMEDITTLF